MADGAIRTRGLAATNRALGQVSKDMRKEVISDLREIGQHVRDTAETFVPKRKRPRVKGVPLGKSLKASAVNSGVKIYSNLPQAPVFNYGGTIRPRGVPIKIQKAAMVDKAVAKDAAHVEQELERLFDRIAARNGF